MAIDFINEQEFETLVNHNADVCISIYLEMARRGADVQGNALKLKNGLKDVAETLDERGWNQPKIDRLLEQPRKLVSDSHYWQHQQEGLALFLAPDYFGAYRLPLHFEPLTVVSSRFHIKPILPLMHDDGPFYVLALSQNKVSLLQGTRNVIEEVEAEQLAASLDEALAYDDPEEQLQHHTTTSGSSGGPEVVHHGHSPGDEKRARLRRFIKHVADSTAELLRGETTPLVLAAVDYLHPMFRDAFPEPHLLDKGIEGNPENLSGDTLRERAWEIVAPHVAKPREEARARFDSLAHGDQATDDLETVVTAAFQGRVDTLFVSVNDHVWGDFDLQTGEIAVYETAQQQGEDLLDFAAVQTLANGGTVYALDRDSVPGNTGVAAIFRF